MRFHTVLQVKRDINTGQYSKMVVNVDSINEITELIPEDREIQKWAMSIVSGHTRDIIHIKVKRDLFDTIVKKLYSYTGKHVELHEKDTFLWRIPMKKGVAFFENIDRIFLISSELRVATIVIHV